VAQVTYNNIVVIFQDRCLENMKIKASFISLDYTVFTCFSLYLKGKTNDFGKGATFHDLCPFCREASEFRSEWGIETAGVM
jgi:hypothetical protein